MGIRVSSERNTIHDRQYGPGPEVLEPGLTPCNNHIETDGFTRRPPYGLVNNLRQPTSTKFLTRSHHSPTFYHYSSDVLLHGKLA